MAERMRASAARGLAAGYPTGETAGKSSSARMPMAEAKRGLSKVAASQTVPRPMSAAQRTRHSN